MATFKTYIFAVNDVLLLKQYQFLPSDTETDYHHSRIDFRIAGRPVHMELKQYKVNELDNIATLQTDAQKLNIAWKALGFTMSIKK